MAQVLFYKPLPDVELPELTPPTTPPPPQAESAAALQIGGSNVVDVGDGVQRSEKLTVCFFWSRLC